MNKAALPHFESSKQFLRASEIVLAAGLRSPAISLAIHSSILAKDALLIANGITPPKPKSHRAAVAQLKTTGLLPESSVLQFSSLLASKTPAEYDVVIFVEERAQGIVTKAGRFVDTVAKQLGYPDNLN